MPSTDMTLHLLKYREAARHLWNSFLLDEETFANGTFPDDFLFDRWTGPSGRTRLLLSRRWAGRSS